MLTVSRIWAQPAQQEENQRIIATLDSLTHAFHISKNPSPVLSEMNTYGFCEEDIPRYSDSVINYRLSMLESPIPLEYNEHVRGFIDLYAVRKRQLTSKILALSRYYFPMFEQILDQQKLPVEFKYLAVIESALNPRAVSVAGANGLWQFIHSTGLLYGLKINSYVDERRDPYKSTLAACQYFKDSYALYGDWLLVIASYNCGPGNVNKAIRRSGGKMNFWEIMPYLPRETRGYVPAFIAAAYVLNYHKEHNIYPMELEVKLNVDTVRIDNSISFSKLSELVNLDVSVIEDLNPSYKKGIIPWYEGKAPIVLPYEYAMRYAGIRDTLSVSPVPAENLEPVQSVSREPARQSNKSGKKKVYVVQRGEGLFRISRKFNCSVDDIKKWNRLKSDKLVPGQKLQLYPSSDNGGRNEASN